MSILLTAIMNGVLYCFSISMLSFVWGMSPSFMSMTRIAMSARFPPLLRSEVNAAWPGVSIKSSPGIVMLSFSCSRSEPHIFFMVPKGMMLAPIAWVIPPASRAAVAVPLMVSRRLVLPWSTCPMTATMGCRIMFIESRQRYYIFLGVR